MRLLLVGGAGEIGRHLTEYYLRSGHEVLVYDRSANPQMAAGRAGLTIIKGDLEDIELLRSVVPGSDFVVNLAWSFADNAAALFRSDLGGHINLLEVAASARIQRFVYASTAAVYGSPRTEPVTEEHPCLVQQARNPLYALAKYAAEQLCHVYNTERGLPITILRFWWAFGETIGGKHLRNMVRAAVNNDMIQIVKGAGGCFVTMEDLAAAILLAGQNTAISDGVYNIGSLFLTWSEIVAMLVEATGSRSPIVEVLDHDWTGPAFLRERWQLSCTKASREIAFQPRRDGDAMRDAFRQALIRCCQEVKDAIKP
ncbi:NAD-dependent epimerase/dehydratase family protein [Sporolituus thermophilus]|uniref:NAD dependent epimerase/dehydratase family protein n=1 Tax=Sporolituus thermophilus DSM 23256 TaxID=1123285 RepID=A0A1G7LHD0_9FIRM|nr:NAD(P)-dependent oxidoreductase [Sporolituus thermophilus]SDF48843.1 NAD dependent epimerase/dehydratase family protein [Sporolituus thermophilus DSM 23256]